MTQLAIHIAIDARYHRENSPVTQTTWELTLLSWGGWPREKNNPHTGHTASQVRYYQYTKI